MAQNAEPMAIPDRYRVVAAERGSVETATADMLREAILDGAIPSGTWLREVSLSKSLGVSRTPLRAALSRLEDEGLVNRENGAGARVAELSMDDMSVIYHVRGRLESLAARFAVARMGAHELSELVVLQQQMRDAADRRDLGAFAAANVHFHRQLAAVSGNRYLIRLLVPVEIALRRFGSRSLTSVRMSEILSEHDAILEAFRLRDADAAGAAAETHAEQARTSTLARMIDRLG